MARLLQIFLEYNDSSKTPNIYEVSQLENGLATCNCPTFLDKSVCRHSRTVNTNKVMNGGVYKFSYPANTKAVAPPEDATDEEFRAYVIKHTKPLITPKYNTRP